MEITKLFGLPAHPLIVHIPIVLIPLSALGVVAMAVWPPMRDRIGWMVVALTGVALLGVQLAIDSGEPLEESVERSRALRRHTHLAEQVRPLAAILFVGVLAFMILHRRAANPGRGASSALDGGWLRIGVLVVTVLFSLITTVQLVRVGHNGARATWQKVKVESGEHGERGEGGEGREQGGG